MEDKEGLVLKAITEALARHKSKTSQWGTTTYKEANEMYKLLVDTAAGKVIAIGEPYKDASPIHSRAPVEGDLVSEYEKLVAKHMLLLTLVGKEAISNKIRHLFTDKLQHQSFSIKFHPKPLATMNAYADWFSCLDRIYKTLLTIIHHHYFLTRWVESEILEFKNEDLISIYSIRQESPGEIRATGIAEVVAGLKDVLSVGKQVEEFRMANINIENAKLELKMKKAEIEEEIRKRGLTSELAEVDLEIARQRKNLELEELKTKCYEQVRKRNRLYHESIMDHLEMALKRYKVLSEIPDKMAHEIKEALALEIRNAMVLDIQIESVDMIERKDTN